MDKLQDIIEARRHNFMVQSERRAAAAKERALGGHQKKEDSQSIFRAVPVNVVAEPTLSMSVKSGDGKQADNRERSHNIPTLSAKTAAAPKGAKSVNEKKKSFEAKEKEIKASMANKPLNRALTPRGSESPQAKDSGTNPLEGRSREQSKPTYNSKFGARFRSPSPNTSASSANTSTDSRAHHGRLFGEIQQFGGHAGLQQRQSPSPSPPSQRKTPPKVLPKPVRSKSVTDPPDTSSLLPRSKSVSDPPAPPLASTMPARPATTGGSGLSKTLSSWKKSRAVSAPPVPASRSKPFLAYIF